MTTFVDGPAKGQHLMLHRAARFLRAVESNGKWDALDQPQDKPEPGEKIYAYEIVGTPAMCHILSGKRGASGFYPIAEYRFVQPQPADEQMRFSNSWHDWCVSHPQRSDLPPQV